MEAERWRNMTASIANGRSKYACVGTNPLNESYARGGGWNADAKAIPLSESSASRGRVRYLESRNGGNTYRLCLLHQSERISMNQEAVAVRSHPRLTYQTSFSDKISILDLSNTP